MSRAGDSGERGTIRWADVLAWVAELEEEHRVSIYLHLFPFTTGRNCGRWAVRLDICPCGAGYRGKSLFNYLERWPNGRQTTLAACVYRTVLEAASHLDQRAEAQRSP